MAVRLIGLAGKAGCGKDTCANSLQGKIVGDIRKLSFAAPLKDACRAIFGGDYEGWWGASASRNLKIPGWPYTYREVLQKVGTDLFREQFHTNIWLDCMLTHIRNIDKTENVNIVITDVRFDNEAEMIRKIGGTIIHIQKPGTYVTKDSKGYHKSEDGVIIDGADRLYINSGTLEDLATNFPALVKEIPTCPSINIPSSY